jgi:hypothetical protein
MKEKQETRSKSGINIGAGAGVGVVLGAAFADLLSDSSLVGIIGMILGAMIGAAIGSRYFPQIHLMEYPKGVVRRLVISGALFVIVLLTSIYFNTEEIGQSLQIILALAPAIPGLFFIVSIGYAISRLDDLQRKIQVEAIAIGFGITILITMTYGLLAQAGLPQANWLIVTVIMVLSWLAGKLWIMWKYR